MGMQGRQVPQHEIESMLTWRWKRGMSVRGIAAMLGRSHRTVQKYTGIESEKNLTLPLEVCHTTRRLLA